MQSHQLKIDAFCRPITPTKNDQPPQQPLEVSNHQIALPAPTKRRRRIVDSDSDEGRAVMTSPDEHKDRKSNSTAAMHAPAGPCARADAADAPTQQQTSKINGGSPGQTVSRTIHTESVTQV